MHNRLNIRENLDLANSLKLLTKRNYEECVRDLQFNKVTTILGDLDVKKFYDLGRSRGAREPFIIKEIQRITARSYESILIEKNMPKLGGGLNGSSAMKFPKCE